MKQAAFATVIEPTSSAAPNHSRRPSPATRLWRAAEDELWQLRPAVQLAQGLSRLLPQLRFNRLRTALYRAARVSIGTGSLLMGDIVLAGSGDPSLVSVGDFTYVTGPLRIDLGGSVRIGTGVNIGHDCLFLTVDHEIGNAGRRAGELKHGSIVIEDGAWVASRVTILPGCTVGRGAIVAAGAVVASDIAPNTMVGGVPAKLIRRLDTQI